MKEITYNEIHKILVNHHKAYKNAVVLNEEEDELINDYISDLDMDIEEYFDEVQNESNMQILQE